VETGFCPKKARLRRAELLPNPLQLGVRANAARNGGETARHELRRSQFQWSYLFVLPVPPENKSPGRPTTVLLPMRVGTIWRVQIVWPNGSIHYFGVFTSRESAVEWIKAHAWLTMPPPERHPDDASG